MQSEKPAPLDARLFAPESVSPETKAFNAQLEAILAKIPPVYSVPPQITREVRESGRGPFGAVVRSPLAVDRQIRPPGTERDVPVRIIVPPGTVRGVYLHLHGGGWVLGRPHHTDVQNEELARAAGLAVVSVDYRLAPENPYPAGPDDCEAAALWLVAHAAAELGSDRLLIGGESAGAHLSVVTMLRLRDRHGLRPFRAANLVYGAYDLTMTPSQRLWGDRNLMLSTPVISWFAGCFVPPERRREPDVSPLYADLRGLPPALFTVGTLDPLLDDSLFMHGRWLAAGNPAELAVYPGAIHGFNLFQHPLARPANQRAADFLAAALAADSR